MKNTLVLASVGFFLIFSGASISNASEAYLAPVAGKLLDKFYIVNPVPAEDQLCEMSSISSNDIMDNKPFVNWITDLETLKAKTLADVTKIMTKVLSLQIVDEGPAAQRPQEHSSQYSFTISWVWTNSQISTTIVDPVPPVPARCTLENKVKAIVFNSDNKQDIIDLLSKALFWKVEQRATFGKANAAKISWVVEYPSAENAMIFSRPLPGGALVAADVPAYRVIGAREYK